MPDRPWMQAAWFRVIVIIVAVIVAGYALLVPATLLALSIGSTECLGPGCGLAVPLTLIGGGLGVLAGIATAVLLVVLAIRPSRPLLIAGLIGLAILPAALLVQGWSLRILDEGRGVAAEASQLSFAIDRSMQEVLVEVTGGSSLQQPGILGPEGSATACELADGQPGYQAWSRLTFTDSSPLSAQDRQEIQARFDQTRERMILIPAEIALTQDWQPDGSQVHWTVTASCLPLPRNLVDAGGLPDDAVVQYRYTDASIPPEYHRSYTLQVRKDLTTITVDSYGDLLFEGQATTTPQAWQALSEGYAGLAALTSPPQGTCTGDTSSSVTVSSGGQELIDLFASSCDEASVVAGQLDDWIAPARALFPAMEQMAPTGP